MDGPMRLIFFDEQKEMSTINQISKILKKSLQMSLGNMWNDEMARLLHMKQWAGETVVGRCHHFK